MSRKVFTRKQVLDFAEDNSLGTIYFEYKIAQNTGKEMEVGYVSDEFGSKVLFCKRQSFMMPGYYNLCNQYEDMAMNE